MNQLQLKTDISTDGLAQIEVELVSIFYECLMKYRSRIIHHRIPRLLSAAVKPLCLLGLLLSLLGSIASGVVFTYMEFDYVFSCFFLIQLLFVLFFLFMLVLFWDKNKAEQRYSKIYVPYWMWLAKLRASSMLKVAKKTAPFTAEYDFRGDLAVYFRTKNEAAAFVWSRRIKGFHLAGSRFTLLFKKEKSNYPYAIILHDLSGALESYLTELGIQAFARPERQNS